MADLLGMSPMANSVESRVEPELEEVVIRKISDAAYQANISVLTKEVGVLELFVALGLCQSRGEARRVSAQGGLWIGETRVGDEELGWRHFLKGKDLIVHAVLRRGRRRRVTLALKVEENQRVVLVCSDNGETTGFMLLERREPVVPILDNRDTDGRMPEPY